MATRVSGYDGGGGGFGASLRRNPICLGIITLTVALFLFDALATGLYRPDFSLLLNRWLGCTPEGILNGRLWQLFTYPLLPAGLLATVFSAYFYFVFGGMLEARLGSLRFLGLYLWGSAGAAALATGIIFLLQQIAPGLQMTPLPAAFSFAPQLALLVVFALFQPNQQVLFFFVIPVKMKFLAVFAVAAAGFAALTSLRWGVGFPHLVELCGALAGYLWFKFWFKYFPHARFLFLRKYLGYLQFRRNKLRIIKGSRDGIANESDKYLN